MNTPATAEQRAEFLHKNNAPKNWVILTVEEVEAARLDLEARYTRLEQNRDDMRNTSDAFEALVTKMESKLQGQETDMLKACYGFIGAMEITRKALSAIRAALKKGMTHARKDLEQILPRLEAERQQCHLDHKGPAHINSNIRLFDLVRYSRSDLHQAQLISDEEYFWLCAEAEHATSPEGGSPSRQRLEDYDELRQNSIPIADLKPFLAAIRDYANYNGGCGHHPDDCLQEAEECKIVAAFNTAQLALFHKHPAAHFPSGKS